MGQYFKTSQNGIKDKQSGTEGVVNKYLNHFYLFINNTLICKNYSM